MSTLALLGRQLDVQSMMLAFNDGFFVSFVLMLFVFPLVLLLKRPKHAPAGPVMAHEYLAVQCVNQGMTSRPDS